MSLSTYLPSEWCLCCCDSSVGLCRSRIPTPTSGIPVPDKTKYTKNGIMNEVTYFHS